MRGITLVAALVTVALAQNLEDCSSGGPEFWCASCGNAEACSALIPGLVDYCEQIGIFVSGQCGGGPNSGGPDPVTIPPTTNPPTAPGPTVTDSDGRDGNLPISANPTEESATEITTEPESWEYWVCMNETLGVIPGSPNIIDTWAFNLTKKDTDEKYKCWETCKNNTGCAAMSVSPRRTDFRGRVTAPICYLLDDEEFVSSRGWESATRRCWTECDALPPQWTNMNTDDLYVKGVGKPVRVFCDAGYTNVGSDVIYCLEGMNFTYGDFGEPACVEDPTEEVTVPTEEPTVPTVPPTQDPECWMMDLGIADESWDNSAILSRNNITAIENLEYCDWDDSCFTGEDCISECLNNFLCVAIAISEKIDTGLTEKTYNSVCYTLGYEALEYVYGWTSAAKSCWRFEDIIPRPNPPSRDPHPFPENPPLSPPWINIPPVNITVPPGATAQFKCAASGSPAPTITIMAQDEALHAYNSPSWTERYLAMMSNPETSAVNIIQEIEDVTLEHQGWYTCMAGNVQGAVYEDAYLEVVDLCGEIKCEPPRYCEADYILGIATCICVECETTFDAVCGFDCNTYFNPCQLEQMNCEEGTNIGIWTQGMCPTVVKPNIENAYLARGDEKEEKLRANFAIDQPVNIKTIELVNEFEYFIMICEGSGNPPPKFSWWKDGEMVAEGPEYEVYAAVAEVDDGVYTCRAMNCIFGGEKETVYESHGIEVVVKDEPDGDKLGKPCQVFGDPHVVTYDNKVYDYMGDCNYVLSMDCEWGEWIVYGNFKQCGPKDIGYPASCLVDVTVFYDNIGLNLQRGWIVVHRGEKVPLILNGEVEIVDSGINTGIMIRYDGLYVTVKLPNDILITWDGIISTQVILKEDSTRNTCGLCGNNDGNPDNEFKARFKNKVNADSINVFGNSWEVDRMDKCVPVDEEMKAEEFCALYPDRAREGSIRCPELFGNAVFDECRPFLSTDPYEEKCRYDFCALDELREILLADCGTAAAYVQQCKALSGVNISASRWRNAVNCPTIQEHQNNTVAQGCPQDVKPWTRTVL